MLAYYIILLVLYFIYMQTCIASSEDTRLENNVIVGCRDGANLISKYEIGSSLSSLTIAQFTKRDTEVDEAVIVTLVSTERLIKLFKIKCMCETNI